MSVENAYANLKECWDLSCSQVAEMCAYAGAHPDAAPDTWTLRDALIALKARAEKAEKRMTYLEAGIVRIIEVHEDIATQEEERAALEGEPDALRDKLKGRAYGRRYVTEKLHALKNGHLIVPSESNCVEEKAK